MKKLLVVLVLLCVALPVMAQTFGKADTSIKLYWQPASEADISDNNPYRMVRPTIDTAAVFGDWMDKHVDKVTGALSRPTEIALGDLVFLDLFFGDNDLIALYEQISRFGPIKDALTLSMIKTVSVTRDNAEPAWTCSLGEVLSIFPWFNIRMGTYDGGWPQRYQPGA
jgi:hypothetical protein